jgi:prophage antirepressor-like protein
MNTFEFGGSKIFTITDRDSNVWFKGFDVANILGYVRERDAIRQHVDDDDKRKRGDVSNRGDLERFEKNETNQIMINESGMYSLVLRSKLESAKAFKRWITSEVLPSIRKTGRFKVDLNKAVKQNLVFKIENEFQLHTKVVDFIKNFYSNTLMTVCNPELSNNSVDKRIKCAQLGYVPGTFDLIINNLHKSFNGFAIEFKSPNGKGVISDKQSEMKTQYEANNFKTLISNSYDQIITEIIEYMRNTRLKCSHCSSKFKSSKTLKNHCKYFHRIL